jgi:hypothetical protein
VIALGFCYGWLVSHYWTTIIDQRIAIAFHAELLTRLEDVRNGAVTCAACLCLALLWWDRGRRAAIVADGALMLMVLLGAW